MGVTPIYGPYGHVGLTDKKSMELLGQKPSCSSAVFLLDQLRMFSVYVVCQRGSSLVPIIGVATSQENVSQTNPRPINHLENVASMDL